MCMQFALAKKQAEGSKRRKLKHSDFPALQETIPKTKLGKFAARILPAEWDAETIVTNPSAIKKALAEGDPLPGNLVLSQDRNVGDELKQMVEAFEVTEALSFACVAEASSVGPSLAVWWQGSKLSSKPHRIKVAVRQLTATIGPEPKPPRSVEIRHKPKQEMCTLRLLAPSHYRAVFIGPKSWDTPSSVIATLARILEKPVKVFTGGTWETLQASKGTCLVAHLRVPLELAKLVVQRSGTQALFATIVHKNASKEPVSWLRRESSTSDEDFFRIAWASAESQGNLPLALRQSGSADLGVIGGFNNHEPRARHFVLHGAPRDWDESDVRDFFFSVQWIEVTVLSRRKGRFKGSPPEWLVRAMPPKDSSEDSWSYADIDCCLTVVPECARKQRTLKSTKLQAPKKRWVDNRNPRNSDVTPAVPVTQLDSSEEEDETATQVGTSQAKLERARSRSPPHRRSKKAPKPLTPDQVLLKDLGPWSLNEAGGCGDCGFRAAGVALQNNQQKSPFSQDGLMRTASTLRLLAANHIAKHKKDYIDNWAFDENEDTSVWGSAPAPTTFEEYVKAIARRETWIDELQLQALAERQGAPIIIFYYCLSDNAWLRAVYAPWWKDNVAQTVRNQRPVVLALRNKHYRALLPHSLDVEISKAWLQRTSLRGPGTLRGAGQDPPNLCSKPASPHTRSPDSDDRLETSNHPKSLQNKPAVGPFDAFHGMFCSKRPSGHLSRSPKSSCGVNCLGQPQAPDDCVSCPNSPGSNGLDLASATPSPPRSNSSSKKPQELSGLAEDYSQGSFDAISLASKTPGRESCALSLAPLLQCRPAVPSSGLCRRFGWQRQGTSVLEYMSKVQALIWETRWSRTH